MTAITFACSNPQCRVPLTFDPAYAGSRQRCPNCHHEILVPAPGAVVLSPMYQPPAGALQDHQPSGPGPQLVPPPGYAQPMIAPMQQFAQGQHGVMPNVQQHREMQTHTARKLNMGSGCLAMLAVIFGIGLVGVGIAVLTGLDSTRASGLIFVLAGLAGVPAFIFFGYIATETSSTARGLDKR